MVDGSRKRSPSELMNESLSSNPNNRSEASFGPSGKGLFENQNRPDSSLNKNIDIRSNNSRGEQTNLQRDNEKNPKQPSPRFSHKLKVSTVKNDLNSKKDDLISRNYDDTNNSMRTGSAAQ